MKDLFFVRLYIIFTSTFNSLLQSFQYLIMYNSATNTVVEPLISGLHETKPRSELKERSNYYLEKRDPFACCTNLFFTQTRC